MKLKELKDDILSRRIPENVGIILDGNGRWATKRGLPRIAGHAKGIKTLVEISKVSKNIGVKNLLVYAFSTENWRRPEPEVSFLMNQLVYNFEKYRSKIIEDQVCVRVIGERENLSPEVLSAIDKIEKLTKDFKGFTLIICFNYGSRQEIVNAVKTISNKVKNNEIDVNNINEQLIDDNLYTNFVGPIDLLIRTSGEERLSNFLLWQLAYSEFVFTKTYWPDFHEKEFYEAIKEYQLRNRRFGGIKNVK